MGDQKNRVIAATTENKAARFILPAIARLLKFDIFFIVSSLFFEYSPARAHSGLSGEIASLATQRVEMGWGQSPALPPCQPTAFWKRTRLQVAELQPIDC